MVRYSFINPKSARRQAIDQIPDAAGAQGATAGGNPCNYLLKPIADPFPLELTHCISFSMY